MSDSQVSVPPQLENILLEYTIRALVDKPEDIISHAADYFEALRDENERSSNIDPEEMEIAFKLGPRSERRASVMGERFNPEEDEDDDDEIEMFPKSDEDRQCIRQRIKDIFLFKSLDKDALNEVIDAMMPREVEKDMVIIREGDDGDFFYVVDCGTFDVYKKKGDRDTLIKTYEDSGSFGELALLHNQPRAATVKAATDGRVWAVSRKSFKRLVVKKAFEKRQKYMKLLESVPELQPLSDYEKMQVCDALTPVTLVEDEVLFREGDEGDGMYFIEEGKVSVTQKNKKEDHEIEPLKKGDYFGELALIKKQPRAAGIVALEDTKLAFLEVNAFERLLGPCRDVMKRRMDSYEQS